VCALLARHGPPRSGSRLGGGYEPERRGGREAEGGDYLGVGANERGRGLAWGWACTREAVSYNGTR
jgi:hypothetical protein